MVNRPRGTRDFAPDEMARRRHAGARLRRVFHRFGYREVATPAFEELELFTAKSGEGIVGELYDFEDKGGRRMCLRPELTAPVMRMYFQDHAFDPKPVKWFYHQSCYRYDRPQAGRYREFWQFGCEQIGAGTPLAYAELIALADHCLADLGLKGRDLAVGHVGLLGAAMDALGVSADVRGAALRLVDKGDMDGALTALGDAGADAGALGRLGKLLQADSIGAVADAVATLDGLAAGAVEELRQVREHLADFGVQTRLDVSVARGLDYYTGIVFEAHCPALDAQSQVLGGGGYDLSAIFGGQATPTMGFGLGFDRLLVALEKEGTSLPGAEGPTAYFGALSDAARREVIRVASRLRRDHGIDVDIDLLGRKPSAIAKAADACGAMYLIILGDRDLEAGKVEVKELRSGDAKTLPVADLEHFLLEESGEIDLADYN